ncbi:MAG: sugar phosphate isomerase/epimerase [Fimbriimonadales bacterium]
MNISVQLYTLRSLTESDFLGTCQRVADIGYKFVELAGFGGLAASEIKNSLRDFGLTVSGSHVGPDALDKVDAVIEEHKLIGCKHVIIPWFPDSMRVDANDWMRTTEQMQSAAMQFKANGMTLSFHNHAFDFQPMGGTNNWEYLFSNAPDLFAEPDTHWVHCAGYDSATVIRSLPGRTPCVHFKDSLADGEMTEVGDGILDWAEILAACDETGVQFAVVEHDNPSDALESVRQSFEFLQKIVS